MFEELDPVALTHDIENYSLKNGDIGTLVYSYRRGDSFEFEFVTGEGKTIALLTLTKEDIRPIGGMEVLHARPLTRAAS
ncbi:MAG: DUF4926 domain-containing protein [Desulfobacteraceae bacterium]